MGILDLNKSTIFNSGSTSVPNTFCLMTKDKKLLIINNKQVEIINKQMLPLPLRAKNSLDYFDVVYWLSNRVLPIQRENAKAILNRLGLPQADNLVVAMTCKGLSLVDTYWIKTSDEENWSNVNLYDNKFSEAVAQLAFNGHTKLSVQGHFNTPELTNQGAYRKCWRREEDGIYLYKGIGSWGLECAAEVAVSKLLNAVGVNHVKYDLTTLDNSEACKSKNITNHHTSILTYEDFSSFCVSSGINAIEQIKKYYSKDFAIMNIIDYLVDNTDRHSLNWGFLIEVDTGKVQGLHPLFDHNNALQFRYPDPISIVFDNKPMKRVAINECKSSDSWELVEAIKSYTESQKGINEFEELFNSNSQINNINKRCNEILKWRY